MSVHVNGDNILSLLRGVAQNLKIKIDSIDLTDQQKSQLALIDKILKSGDGSKYLSDNGVYKNIPLDKIGSMNDNIKTIYDLLKIEYNAGDVWNANYNTMTTARYGFGCVEYSGKIYCIGGYNGSTITYVEVYDVISNSWIRITDMPTARTYFGCIEYNGNIYCIAGRNPNASSPNISKVEVYNITSNTWSTGSNMPTSRYSFGCVEYNGKIYCIGGSLTTNKVEVYDITSNTWSSNYNVMPTARYSFGCVKYNGKIYCIGGAASGTINKVEVYDIVSNTWSTNYNNIPTARYNFGCVEYNGKIYCIGGYGNSYLNTIEVYDVLSNTWNSNYNIIPTTRSAFGYVQYNGKVYCIGGYSNIPTNKVEVYDMGYAKYNITLASDISNKLSLLVTNGTGAKLLTDNGTYQEYIPSGYREMSNDELNNVINYIKQDLS